MTNPASAQYDQAAPTAAKRISALAAKLVLGDDITPTLWPILFVTLMSTTTFTGVWSYAGVWAITDVHASSSAVGAMFLAYAIACGVTGYVGGRLSDRLGRRRVMIGGWSLASALILALPLGAGNEPLQLSLAVLAMAAGSPATAASNTVVADLVGPAEQERGYAATRVMFNLGTVLGPPAAGLLLLAHSWALLFVAGGISGLATVALVLWRLPRTSVEAGGETGNSSSAERTGKRGILNDRAFLLLLASTLLGYFIYVTYSSVLPVVAVSSYHLEPAAWGFIYAINPIIVILLQMRITRWTDSIAPASKLAAASLLMGSSFLILLALPNVLGVVTLTCMFVVGEMLWAPVSQGLAVRMAPEGMRGSYMGAFRGAGQVAMGLAPFVVLRVHNLGNNWSWLFISVLSIFAASVGAAAAHDRDAGARAAR